MIINLSDENVTSVDSDFLVFDVESDIKEHKNQASKIPEENSSEDVCTSRKRYLIF
jgi:hypothetical protein